VNETPMPFESEQRELIEAVLVRLAGHPETRDLIRRNVDRLLRLGDIVQSFPSLYEETVLAGRHRTVSTLLDELVSIGPLASPFRFPVKASLARDFVLAKIQLFRSAILALEAHQECHGGVMCARLRAEIAQSIYTLLMESLLLEVLADLEVSTPVRQRAGEWLVRFWDDVIAVEIHDFCPLLESAWKARNSLVVRFGTLMGSDETFQLIGRAVDPRFMRYFAHPSATDEELQAFEEFLFGLDYEQLETLKREMRSQQRNVVDAAWVAETLGVPEAELFSGVEDAEAMFLSYRQRRRAAAIRRVRRAPGPHSAAEMYLMHYLLERETIEAQERATRGLSI
jgi:hypothetical protein